jgi:4-hydroxybenzoate polyprenyltransferase
MSAIKNYFSLIKFSHTIFAMPFAFIGFCLGWLYVNLRGVFEQGTVQTGALANDKTHLLWLFLLVVACMVLARSAAMAFNRWLDQHFDAQNPRTAIREIPAGLIKSDSALWFVIICCVLFVLCTWFINRICFYLSPVAWFVILFYSYTKRFTALCHLVLGLGLSLAPIGAFLAVTGSFHWLPILFSLVVLCWVSGFDIIYALQDEAFDKAHQLHSIPVWLGKAKALHLSEALHLAAFLLLLAIGWLGAFSIFYWLGAAFFGGLLVYQHRLVKPNDLSKVNLAFFTTNGVASVVFAALVIVDILFF